MLTFSESSESAFPPWPRGGAADPRSGVPLARLTVQKVAEPLLKKGGGWWNWGAPFECFSLKSDAPCAGCGEKQSALLRGESAANGSERTTSPQSLRCCWSFLEDFRPVTKGAGLYTSSTANMYSAAVLLMLAVRTFADSMDAPTGKRRGAFAFCGVSQRAPVSLLTRVRS